MMRVGERIPDELLDRFVAGTNLVPGTLRDQLGPEPTLFVFLRHFGCIFCRETLSEMRAISGSDPRFPKSLFFFQGSPTEGRVFLRRYWPGVPAIADPSASFYEAFGIERSGLVRMLGPSVWSAQSRARAKGHRNGERSGDIWRMPGVFLCHESKILWAHEYGHAGDHPDYQVISEVAASAKLERAV